MVKKIVPPEPMLIEDRVRRWFATGTKQQILDAGLCTPAHFPEGRKRARYGLTPDDCCWSVEAVGGGRWRLVVDRGHQEVRDLTAKIEARGVARRAPKTPDERRQRSRSYLEHIGGALRNVLVESFEGGCNLAEADIRRIDALMARIGLVIENATIPECDAATQEPGPIAPTELRAPLSLAWSASNPVALTSASA